MALKKHLLGAACAATLAGGAVAGMALPAQAASTPLGSCTGQLTIDKFKPALSDVTQIGISVHGSAARDQTTKDRIVGSCDGASTPGVPARTGDADIPQPTTSLTPKAVAVSLLGNASCAAAADDPNSANAWPLNGKVTYTMTQTYTDMVNGHVKPYKLQADVQLLGFNAAGPDVVDVAGIVTTGLAVGAQVSGTIWEDPVAKTKGSTGYNTGYELDTGGALGCIDSTPNNASIPIVMSGGGGATSTSLLGSTADGLSFSLGE